MKWSQEEFDYQQLRLREAQRLFALDGGLVPPMG
jgi:hypothetical protein